MLCIWHIFIYFLFYSQGSQSHHQSNSYYSHQKFSNLCRSRCRREDFLFYSRNWTLWSQYRLFHLKTERKDKITNILTCAVRHIVISLRHVSDMLNKSYLPFILTNVITFMVNIFFRVKWVKIYIAVHLIFENGFFTSINDSSVVFYRMQ